MERESSLDVLQNPVRNLSCDSACIRHSSLFARRIHSLQSDLDDVEIRPNPASPLLDNSSALAAQFAAANSEELGVKCVPSLNLVYTEEEGYVTADVAEDKNLVSCLGFSSALADTSPHRSPVCFFFTFVYIFLLFFFTGLYVFSTCRLFRALTYIPVNVCRRRPGLLGPCMSSPLVCVDSSLCK